MEQNQTQAKNLYLEKVLLGLDELNTNLKCTFPLLIILSPVKIKVIIIR